MKFFNDQIIRSFNLIFIESFKIFLTNKTLLSLELFKIFLMINKSLFDSGCNESN